MTYVSEEFLEVLPSGDIFHYSPNRMFGPYTEILELARIKYSNETQVMVSLNRTGLVKMDEPVVGTDYSFGGVRVAFLHPIDYVWLLIRDPFLADKIVQYYIRWRIESQAHAAEHRLEKMVARMSNSWLSGAAESLLDAFTFKPVRVNDARKALGYPPAEGGLRG